MRVLLNQQQVYCGTGSGAATNTGPVIAFVHGAGFDHSVWVMPARYFARHGYWVLVPDLPGHGRSSGPPLQTVDAMADWLLQVLDAAYEQPTPVVLVGHSLGSLVAAVAATRSPAHVVAVALLGTSMPMPVGAPLLDAAQDNHPAAYAMANTWSHSTAGRLGAAAVPGMSNFWSGQRLLEHNSDDVYFADLRACNNFAGLDNPLRQRTLVIVGGSDKMTRPQAGLNVGADCADATVQVLPGSGHAMLSEQPNQVLDALIGFVTSLELES